MVRYPFLTWVEKYLAVVGDMYAKSTMDEVRRRYRRMEKDLKALYENGSISTCHPEKLTPEDVAKYIGSQKARGLKGTAISHNVTVLNNLLQYVGNTAVQQCMVKYPQSRPRKTSGRFPSMSEEDFRRIIAKAATVDDSDWTRMKAYSIVVLALCSGLRLKELRLSRVGDLDTCDWVIFVEHVKGEGSYGEPRLVPIRPEAHEMLRRYFRARKRFVESRCPMNQALFPTRRNDDEDGFFSTNGIEKLKRLVETETGIRFDLRKCRRTFAQMNIDLGLEISKVSRLLGHATTKTTETFYGRMQQEVAVKDTRELWKSLLGGPDAKNTVIGQDNEVTG